MAGKLHADYMAYAASSNTKMAISPFSKYARAYAEGYHAQAVQPTTDPAAMVAYTSGGTDKTAARPPTHVGY
jgi:hypothetical protein